MTTTAKPSESIDNKREKIKIQAVEAEDKETREEFQRFCHEDHKAIQGES